MRLIGALGLWAAVTTGSWSVHQPAVIDVRIGVFGLFRSAGLIARPGDAGIAVRTSSDTCTLRGREEAWLREVGGSVRVVCGGRLLDSPVVRIAGLDGSAAEIELQVPGITRRFRGRIDVGAAAGELVPVVSMELETAVASVVAAEQTAETPLEALKAQAVASRSYFAAARGRHDAFDFCDTTHCQFLREAPAAAGPSARATAATAGLILTFRGTPIGALYSASCGGRTRSLLEVGLTASVEYPYFSVGCSYCVRDALAWQRRLPIDAESRRIADDRSERARLAVVRRNGWDAVPGNNFQVVRDGDAIVLHGRGAGHGIGLCQAGAGALAREKGVSFAEILGYYYPGTQVTSLRP